MSEETKDKVAEAAEKKDENQAPEPQEGADKKNEPVDGGDDAAEKEAAEKKEKAAAKKKEVNVKKGSKTTVNRNVLHNGTYYEKGQEISTKDKDYKELDRQGYVGQ